MHKPVAGLFKPAKQMPQGPKVQSQTHDMFPSNKLFKIPGKLSIVNLARFLSSDKIPSKI